MAEADFEHQISSDVCLRLEAMSGKTNHTMVGGEHPDLFWEHFAIDFSNARFSQEQIDSVDAIWWLIENSSVN
jgi:hypothetical protein